MLTTQKKKIILCRQQHKNKIQRNTPTFTKHHHQSNKPQPNFNHPPTIITHIIQQFFDKVYNIISFHQQLNKIEVLSTIRNTSDLLNNNYSYLQVKLKNRRIRQVFKNLKNNLEQSNSGCLNCQNYSSGQKQTNSNLRIRELQQRVNKIQQLLSLKLRPYRSKSVRDILLSHRNQLSAIQVSTDSELMVCNLQNSSQQMNNIMNIGKCFSSRNLSNFFVSPKNSVILDNQSLSRCSKIVERNRSSQSQSKSSIKLRTKFVKIR